MTPREVAPFLFERKLLGQECVVDGGLAVEDVSRRNLAFKVLNERGPSYLIKRGVDPERMATIAHEARIYTFFQSVVSDKALDSYLPRFYGYDSEEHVLILELVRDAHSLGEYHLQQGRFSITLARAMGTALGSLHRSTSEQAQKKEGGVPSFSNTPPWVLSLHRPALPIFRNISSANLQLIKIIQQFTEFCALLDELRQAWRAETLIHFDIKWDNCIVFAQPPLRKKTRLKIVDWELAGIGDPCWDVGSFFMNYLSFWLLSIPITGETPPDRFLELAPFPLERMQPAIRAFWRSYIRRMGLDTATADEWLLRATRYSAARLIQTAYEQMQMSMQLTGNMICLLQLSLNIMKRPHAAVAHLLGIPRET